MNYATPPPPDNLPIPPPEYLCCRDCSEHWRTWWRRFNPNGDLYRHHLASARASANYLARRPLHH